MSFWETQRQIAYSEMAKNGVAWGDARVALNNHEGKLSNFGRKPRISTAKLQKSGSERQSGNRSGKRSGNGKRATMLRSHPPRK